MPLTREQVREIDRRATEEYGIPSIVLMENAGRQVADIIHHLNPLRERVAICCGPGNNGGDGFVIARHLDRLGHSVNLWLFGNPSSLSPDAKINFNIAQKMLLPVQINAKVNNKTWNNYGIIVDALFGTGLTRALEGDYASAVDSINQCSAKVIAVDIPSGLDCDSGQPRGPAIKADHTITFVGMKSGFIMPSAREFVGQVYFADIGAPRRLIDEYLSGRVQTWTP